MNRQHNGQKKKDKRTNNDLQNIHIKLNIEIHEPHKNRVEGCAVPAPLMALVVLI